MQWHYDAPSGDHLGLGKGGRTYHVKPLGKSWAVYLGEDYLGTDPTLAGAKAIAEGYEECQYDGEEG